MPERISDEALHEAAIAARRLIALVVERRKKAARIEAARAAKAAPAHQK